MKWLYQFQALWTSHFLTRIRTPVSSLMEILSPVLLMWVLVAAYTLSSVTYETAQTYSRINLTIAGNSSLFQTSFSLFNGTADDSTSDAMLLTSLQESIESILEGPIRVPSLSQYIQISQALQSVVPDLPQVIAESSYARQWGNLLSLGTIHVTDTAVQDYIIEQLGNSSLVPVRYHSTEQDALSYIQSNARIERTWALLVNDTKIRMNYTTIPNTNEIVNFVSIGLDTTYQQYYLSGFLTLQETLNNFRFQQSNCSTDYVTYSMPAPTAAYSQNSFFLAVGYLLGLTIVMAFLYPTSRLVKLIVEEKETKMKEFLLIQGVRPMYHWLAWTLSAAVLWFVASILVTATLSSQILVHSSPVYLFAWIGFFASSTMGMCFAIASMFSRAKLASILAPMVLFATILPRFIFFGYNRYEASTQKKWASLLPASAFAFGADIVADYEYSEVGVQSWNAGEGLYSFETSIGFLAFDTVLYIFLGWYLDKVLPRQYGSPLPWWFVFSPAYWCQSCLSVSEYSRRDQSTEINDCEADGDNELIQDASMKVGVSFHDLYKKYKRKASVPAAVNHFSVDLYESQITTLLGSNGAGKSTIVALATGLIPPSIKNSDCFIYGHSIVHNTTKARQSIGMCPQQNVLFDKLTVREHIRLFLRVKGVRPLDESVEEHAKNNGLGEFLNVTALALSGGNKRKLQVAIALCGNPQFLILDEPTSGMDANARRSAWELLRKERIGRTILLTTHFMDEAEILSDRVVLINEGELQCSGSPVFLKDRFGLGYSLTVVVEATRASDAAEGYLEESGGLSFSAVLNESRQRIEKLVKDTLADARFSRIQGSEITFQLPRGCEEEFSSLFEKLKSERGVGAFGVENSSLEEVFITLASQRENENLSSQDERVGFEAEYISDESGTSVTSYEPLSPLHQVRLLYWKRFISQKRDIRGFIFSVIVPVLLIGLILLILTINVPLVGPQIDLSVDLYQFSNVGDPSLTDILVGGGIGTNQSIQPKFDLLQRSLKMYEHANPVLYENLTSSDDVSNFQLQTINDRNYNTRYGSFAYDDQIEGSISIDFNGTLENIQSVLGTGETVRGINFTLDLSDIFGSNTMPNITSLLGGSITISADSVVYDDILSTLSFVGLQIRSGDGSFNISEDEVGFNSDLLLGLASATTFNSSSFFITSDCSIVHNASSPHSVAAFNQLFAENLFQTCTDDFDSRLPIFNHPLPLTPDQATEIKTILSVLASLFILIPLCYIPGAFIVFVVKERSCKSKHLQLVSGVDMTSYWLSTYLFDITMFLMLTILTMVVFLLYGRDSAEVFVGDFESFCCSFLLLFGYGLSVLPFSYLFSRMFDNHSSAQIAIICIIFITGFVAVNAYFIMDSIESVRDLAEALRPWFRSWPAYNVGDGFIMMASAFWENKVKERNKNPFDWDVCGKTLLILYVLSIPYFILLLLLEYSNDGGAGGPIGHFLRSWKDTCEKFVLKCYKEGRHDNELDVTEELRGKPDDDVETEKTFISENLNSLKKNAPLVISKLWKIYPPSVGIVGVLLSRFWRFIRRLFPCSRNADSPMYMPKRAVQDVSTIVATGECYGLLGSNGSGKSTTMNIISGDVRPTSGMVYVAGHGVTGHFRQDGVSLARKEIGYCPQVDPLIDLMTPRETLYMFGRLRGIRSSELQFIVPALLRKLTMIPHADKASHSLSGGNKRKLSLGIALIGDPRVLLIDESSSGLDPVAKRNMWDLIKQVSKNRSVVLTTHSMEEAEALCTRVGIMDHGQVLCLGSVQHLKSKYVHGYMVDIYANIGSEGVQMDTLLMNINEKLPGCTLLEQHGRFLRFEFKGDISLVFSELEAAKGHDKRILQSYSVRQCSLEQVFLNVTNDYLDGKDTPSNIEKGKGDNADMTGNNVKNRNISIGTGTW